MDISNEKISELLKNPEIVGMIASLASGFSSPSENKEKAEGGEAVETGLSAESSVSLAEDTLPKFAEGFGNAVPKDRRIALLQAIKPYVSDTKKDKVDSLVRAIGVAGLLNSYAGGIPGWIFGKN